MNFIEFYFDDLKPEPFIPNKMNMFPRCRYCGFSGDRAQLKYERALMGDAKYECRDSAACGARLRNGQPVGEVDKECPF